MTDLRTLRHLVVLARHLNFSRAAEELRISQPTLSRSIQAFEARLGTRLFDRTRTAVALTPQGRHIVAGATNLITHAAAFETEMLSAAKGEAGHIRFGIAPLPARVLLPGVLCERLNSAPHVTHETVVRTVDALLDELKQGDIEFLVAAEGELADNPLVRTETLGRFPVSLVVRQGHPILASRSTDDQFPLLVSSRSVRDSGILDTLRDRLSGRMHIVEEFETLASLTSRTEAIWATCSFAVIDQLRSGALRELPLPPGSRPVSYRILAYRLGERTPSPAALAVTASIRAEIQKLASLVEALPHI